MIFVFFKKKKKKPKVFSLFPLYFLFYRSKNNFKNKKQTVSFLKVLQNKESTVPPLVMNLFFSLEGVKKKKKKVEIVRLMGYNIGPI